MEIPYAQSGSGVCICLIIVPKQPAIRHSLSFRLNILELNSRNPKLVSISWIALGEALGRALLGVSVLGGEAPILLLRVGIARVVAGSIARGRGPGATHCRQGGRESGKVSGVAYSVKEGECSVERGGWCCDAA